MIIKITQLQLQSIINRIMVETETQAKYNNIEFIGLTAIDICDRIREKLGGDWEIINDEKSHS